MMALLQNAGPTLLLAAEVVAMLDDSFLPPLSRFIAILSMLFPRQLEPCRQVSQFGRGTAHYDDRNDVHEQLRGSYHWGGFWSTSFRIAPRGDWTVIAMAQTAPSDAVVGWSDHYERIAAEAIQE